MKGKFVSLSRFSLWLNFNLITRRLTSSPVSRTERPGTSFRRKPNKKPHDAPVNKK